MKDIVLVDTSIPDWHKTHELLAYWCELKSNFILLSDEQTTYSFLGPVLSTLAQGVDRSLLIHTRPLELNKTNHYINVLSYLGLDFEVAMLKQNDQKLYENQYNQIKLFLNKLKQPATIIDSFDTYTTDIEKLRILQSTIENLAGDTITPHRKLVFEMKNKEGD